MTHTGSGVNSAVMRYAKRCQTGAQSQGLCPINCCIACTLPSGSRAAMGSMDLRSPSKHQAAHIYRAPVASLASPQRLQQVGQELFQTCSTFCNFALGHEPELNTSLEGGQ